MSSRMRVTKGHRNNRRAHHGVDLVTLTTEGETNIPHIRHRANPVTGTYRGRKVIDVNKKVTKTSLPETTKNKEKEVEKVEEKKS